MTREDAIKDIKEHVKLDGNGRIVLVGEISPITIDTAIKALEEQRPKGKWIEPDGSYDRKIWRKCSNCGKHVKKFEIFNHSSYENKINFCSNCGADMEIGE